MTVENAYPPHFGWDYWSRRPLGTVWPDIQIWLYLHCKLNSYLHYFWKCAPAPFGLYDHQSRRRWGRYRQIQEFKCIYIGIYIVNPTALCTTFEYVYPLHSGYTIIRVVAVGDGTGWRRHIGCLKLQVIFRNRATNHRALLRKMTYKNKASYYSTPPCIIRYTILIAFT